VQVEPTSGIMATTLVIVRRSAFLVTEHQQQQQQQQQTYYGQELITRTATATALPRTSTNSCTNSCRVNSMAEPSITSEIEQAQYMQPKEHHRNPETSQLPLGSWPSLFSASTLALASVQGRCRVASALPRAARLPPLRAPSR
jgi:hypothetical protein